MVQQKAQAQPASLTVAPDETTRRLIERLRREVGPRICGYLNDPVIIEIMLNPDGAFG